MKFVHLIEYNTRNIFPEKSYTKCDEETSSKTFSKKSKLIQSRNQQSKVLYSLFLFHAQVEGYQIKLKLRCRPVAFNSFKAFLKNKRRTGTSLPATFSAGFLKENFSPITFY